MENVFIFVFVPLVGYFALWLLGIPLFLVYFRFFRIRVNIKRALAMIKRIPPVLAVITVPICSFVSFSITANLTLSAFSASYSIVQLILLGAVSLLVTIILDLLITIKGERINIRIFPLNLMYLLAWLAVVPAVVLGGTL